MIYFDNAATTRVREEVADIMMKYMTEDYGNPSAVYRFGLNTEKSIDKARMTIADILNVDKGEIFFTPGGTWSNNIAIGGVMSKASSNRAILSPIEHSSVSKAFKNLENKKDIVYLSTDEYGIVDINDLKKKINDRTSLVSIMQVNNELGTIQDIEEIGKVIKSNSDALFHVDGVQGFCKIPLEIKKYIDFYSMSSHKIHGPKGIGALYIKKGISINPISYGGGQEFGISPGTQNVAGIMGFALAAKLAFENYDKEIEYIKGLKEEVLKGINEIDDIRINSNLNSSPYILSVGFKNVKSEVLLHMLDDDGICVSAGSACSGNKKSKVLEAVNIPKDYIDGTIRISFSHYNNIEECRKLVKSLKFNIQNFRKIVGR